MDKHNSRQVNKDLLKFEICTYLFIDYFQHTGVELFLESSRNKKRSEKKKKTELHFMFHPSSLNQNDYDCFLCWYLIC